jgi:hypothetical protein
MGKIKRIYKKTAQNLRKKEGRLERGPTDMSMTMFRWMHVLLLSSAIIYANGTVTPSSAEHEQMLAHSADMSGPLVTSGQVSRRIKCAIAARRPVVYGVWAHCRRLRALQHRAKHRANDARSVTFVRFILWSVLFVSGRRSVLWSAEVVSCSLFIV